MNSAFIWNLLLDHTHIFTASARVQENCFKPRGKEILYQQVARRQIVLVVSILKTTLSE